MHAPASRRRRRRVARALGALRRFLRSEEAGGALLIAASVLALLLANSPFAPGYKAALSLPLFGRASLTPHAIINDGLMSFFFLVVALEIRRELSDGALADRRHAAAPAIAACGGVLAPAAIFVAFNHADPAALRGWAIPVATDIAFSLAVIRTLGPRAPESLKIFLAALAIIDDLLAIVIIALFYSGAIHWAALGGAVAIAAAIRLFAPRNIVVLMLLGIPLWAAVALSGVHPTLAGVALAAAVPTRRRAGEDASPAQRLEDGFGWVVALLVMPLFGLANAGLSFGALRFPDAASPLVFGIVAGLLLGKPAGVLGALRLATALGVAASPAAVTRRQVVGVACLCGIGFTMSLFVAGLAFTDPARDAAVKFAVFAGSLLSALLGAFILATSQSTAARKAAPAATGASGTHRHK